ncbi:ArsR/SmtB family transcription factor [Furfurilactobacillus curtus]|uniref:Transcriptional regulator n=1 Tax=Furfurilactobacillus curtus TaxID=1746200 RepID=A0ABQ5JRF7_9LACO
MAKFTALKEAFSTCSDFLIALGDEKRQAIIIRLLEDQACQGVRVNELTEVTQLSRPAVSHHLKILKAAQLVQCRSIGTKNYYYLTHETQTLDKLQQMLNDVTKIMTRSN